MADNFEVDQVEVFYPSTEEASKAAIDKYGNGEFLIQEITDEVHLNYITTHPQLDQK